MESKKERNMVLHPFTLLLIILAITTVVANFIPSGVYERIAFDGRTIVDPESFEVVTKANVGITTFFLSFYNGFRNAASLMAMIFFAGGAFGVANGIGLLETSLKVVADKLKDTSFYIIAFVLMAVIGVQVAFTSMWELAVVLIPMIVPLILSLGYDVVTGASIVMLASCAGFGAALTNPLFTAIAHKIAELPIYSGLWYRAISFVIILLTCYIYLMVYASKIKKDPTKSVMYGVETKYKPYEGEVPKFTGGQIRAGIVFILMYGFLIYGTINLGFDFQEIAATFVAIAFFVGLAYGLGINTICEYFGEGMKDLFYAGMVMFFARSILYVMEEALIIDTIINALAGIVVGHSPIITAVLLLVMQTIINFFIPSGSGQATITVPIVVPLADMGGVTRQVACLASQFGDGFSNFMYPTNGSLIAILSVAEIPYNRWAKFFFPLFIIIYAICAALVSVGTIIKLGPF